MTNDNLDDTEQSGNNASDFVCEDRRHFLKQSAAAAGLSFAPLSFFESTDFEQKTEITDGVETVRLSLTVNGTKRRFSIDPRVTLLDLLREQMGLTGTKKGCDFGQCGACTVHVNGQRSLSCLSLAVMQNGKKITTIESLGNGIELHPVQEAFVKHDGFQCGYCTPGQIMSALSCIREENANSAVQIQEYMSGNLCRCGAYPNIVNAILEVKNSGQKI